MPRNRAGSVSTGVKDTVKTGDKEFDWIRQHLSLDVIEERVRRGQEDRRAAPDARDKNVRFRSDSQVDTGTDVPRFITVLKSGGDPNIRHVAELLRRIDGLQQVACGGRTSLGARVI